MPWWSWVILGLVLAAIELATPGGFFIIFFGIAALVVGALVLSRVVAAVWIQWLLFPGIAVAALVLFILYKTAVVVPQQSVYVVERLGRYHATLNAGFHVLVPFVDVLRYHHSLKEQAIDIPAQVCITRDNVQVGVDGILYLKVLNPE